MRGQIVSLDAVISLSLLAGMLAVWAYMYQDSSPMFQMYTYRATYLASDHVVNQFLFSPNVPWRCKTPQGVPVSGCVQSLAAVTASGLGVTDLNMNFYIHCVSSGLTTSRGTPPPSSPAVPLVVRSVRACIGDWNSCAVYDCNVEVWHR